MSHGDHRGFQEPTDLSGTDSEPIFEVEPTQFAEPYVSGDGRFRLVADPFGEWIEASTDALVEVRG